MLKKLIGIFILILLISSILIFNPIKNVKALGNTLYVGGSGPGNYSNIQDAINHSNNGDTIFVYNGVYPSNITINKSIVLLGENSEKTIIKNGNNGFLIKVDRVTIKNFTITECGHVQNWDCWGVWISSNDNIIENNKIINNKRLNCIFIEDSTNNLISGNIISNNIYFGIRLDKANNNIIINNNINNDEAIGISASSSSDNIFKLNTLSSNVWGGISIDEYSDNNLFYHNNFINNDLNAYDTGINIWNDNYPSGGNYWSEYNGSDNLKGPNQDISGPDGIGDTPYNIPGGNNKDLYPLMKPYGIPDTPNITGPTKFKPNEIKEFTFKTTDPDDDQIYYYIDWGDESNSGWLGPFLSGTQLRLSHSWLKIDTYTIKCKARDTDELESDWGTLKITIPRIKTLNSNILILLQNHLNILPILQKLLNKLDNKKN